MALDKQALKAGIISLQQEMLTKTEAGMEEYAERLASLIKEWRGNSANGHTCTGRHLYRSYYWYGKRND